MSDFINIVASLLTIATVSVALWRQLGMTAKVKTYLAKHKTTATADGILVLLLTRSLTSFMAANAWWRKHVSPRLQGRQSTAILGAIGLAVLLLVSAWMWRRHAGSEAWEEKITAALAQSDVDGANAALAQAVAEYGERPAFLRLRAAARCRAQLYDDCLKAYQTLCANGDVAGDDQAFIRDFKKLLGAHVDHAGLTELAKHVNDKDAEQILEESAKSKGAQTRLNAIRILSDMGKGDRVDYVAIYSGELAAARSCKEIKAASGHAAELGDARILPALRELQGRVNGQFFKKLCVGDAVDKAIKSLEK